MNDPGSNPGQGTRAKENTSSWASKTQTKVCMKVVAAIGATCTRSVQHLDHDPVVQAGETCCAIDMTEYEKRI